jgi:type I restriction enzyme S subunit
MEEWKERKLGDYILDIAAGPFGSNLKVECFVPTGFPIIDGANLKEFKVTDNITKYVTEEKARSLHRSIAKRNDVVVTISGNVGQISYIPLDSKYEEYLVSQRQFRVTFDTEKVYVPYLVYYFHTLEGQHKILSFANQTGVPALAQPLKNFKNIDICLPEINEQRRIAAILSSLDDKIEVNRRINENLEQQAQALFKSWFVDFEPFKDQPFVESELGMIPEGWRVGTLGDITEHLSSKVGIREDVKVLSPVTTGQLMLSEEYFTKQVFSESISKYRIVPKGSFAYNPARVNIGSIGRNEFDFDGCVSPVYVVFKCKNGYENYFDLFRKTEKFVTEVKLRAIGGVRQSLNYSDFCRIQTILAPQEVVDSFNQIYINIKQVQDCRNKESNTLSSLRDTLLPRLMSGELEVNDIEQIL